MAKPVNSAVLIGAGNVAWHMGHALMKNKIIIKQLVGRSVASSSRLASELQCKYVTDTGKTDTTADIYIISVSDQSVQEVIDSLHLTHQMVVHTSGSLPMSVFEGRFRNFGVLYPFQTFTKEIPLNFHEVPLCVEANSDENLSTIRDFAGKLSGNVRVVNSFERSVLHMAAVFACNFTNHMFHLAGKILAENGMDFEILSPLIHETVTKTRRIAPALAQTGPAVRNDKNIMEKHLKMLEELPEIQDIYEKISESIIRWHKKEKEDGV